MQDLWGQETSIKILEGLRRLGCVPLKRTVFKAISMKPKCSADPRKLEKPSVWDIF